MNPLLDQFKQVFTDDELGRVEDRLAILAAFLEGLAAGGEG